MWFIMSTTTVSDTPAKKSSMQRLAPDFDWLFTMQKPRQKRRLLHFVLSNCTWEDGEVVATFRQPFDMLAETAAAAARVEAGEKAKSAKTEIWLGNLDSNQD